MSKKRNGQAEAQKEQPSGLGAELLISKDGGATYEPFPQQTMTKIGLLKVLIAIPTCEADKELEEACKATWAGHQEWNLPFPMVANIAFLDGPTLGVADGYDDLPIKVQAICKWALQLDYDFLFKCDSDTYVWMNRLFTSGFEQHDYSGWTGGKVAPKDEYASGGAGYWLSRRAMEIVANAELTDDTCEDRWVGRVLFDAGIIAHRNPLHAHGRHDEAAEHKVVTMHPCRSLEWMLKMRDA